MDTATLAYRPADTSVALLDQTVGDALRAAAAEAPDRVAIVEGSPGPGPRRAMTYGDLLTVAEQVARALLARFRPGEHVAVWAGNSLEWIQLEYGAGLAGLVLVTVNPAYQAAELEYVLRQSRSSGLFHMSGFRGNPMAQTVAEVRHGLPDLREVVALDDWAEFVASADPGISLPGVSPLDDAQIQYTSGTTGFPKGVQLHHRGLVNNARLVMQRWGGGQGDVVVSPMPLFHTAGCGLGVLGALSARATLVCLTQFDPALQLQLIESERASITIGVPTMLVALLGHPDSAVRDLSTLRVVVSGGAPVPVEVATECERRIGARFSIVFGTTECSPIITMTGLDAPPDARTGTVGTALPHTEVMIADPVTGRPVSTGTVGEVCARGYLVMHGYFDDPEATAAAIDADGWYHTGDLASMDPDGYLRVEGRLKEMIIRGGENIYPREIEDLLHTHPAVAEVAVVGRPDPTWGETVAAFVRPAAGAMVTEAELHAYCRDRLAAYKTPVTWIFVDAFPLTASGKVRKNVLRERLA
ncbi:MAG TPA: AMP-binding protein [Pseudonocardia sp.]|uniref:AMP-binding protein n=1 Tax=Pseudonocardia sp. TaxID=60912 RepID=UPI002BB3FB5A|nr:AMP-binding protein [Pseudonocardia sp.]HTF50418.1 AMP-binding protein [Pseudonocardia sp.]